MARVQDVAQQQLQRQRPARFRAPIHGPARRPAAHPAEDAARPGRQPRIAANDDDVRNFLHTGQYGELLFPNGNFIGEDKYRQFISLQFNLSTADFEKELKDGITINRLRAFITAGVTVSDSELRDQYRKTNVKIKFDYAGHLLRRSQEADQALRRRSAGILHQERRALRQRRSRRAQAQLLRLSPPSRFPAVLPRSPTRKFRPTTPRTRPSIRSRNRPVRATS